MARLGSFFLGLNYYYYYFQYISIFERNAEIVSIWGGKKNLQIVSSCVKKTFVHVYNAPSDDGIGPVARLRPPTW
jgi:hypothetical protein